MTTTNYGGAPGGTSPDSVEQFRSGGCEAQNDDGLADTKPEPPRSGAVVRRSSGAGASRNTNRRSSRAWFVTVGVTSVVPIGVAAVWSSVGDGAQDHPPFGMADVGPFVEGPPVDPDVVARVMAVVGVAAAATLVLLILTWVWARWSLLDRTRRRFARRLIVAYALAAVGPAVLASSTDALAVLAGILAVSTPVVFGSVLLGDGSGKVMARLGLGTLFATVGGGLFTLPVSGVAGMVFNIVVGGAARIDSGTVGATWTMYFAGFFITHVWLLLPLLPPLLATGRSHRCRSSSDS